VWPSRGPIDGRAASRVLACLLYHTRNTRGRGPHSHSNLDTYLISAGKVLWNSRGREGGRDPPRSAGIALTVNPVFTEELVMSDLKKSV